MTTLRQAAQQALECIERCNKHGWILADFEDEVESAITSLKAALEQPEPEAHSYCYVQRGTSVDILTFDDMPQDAIAGTIYPLYAAPPAAQPEQEPVAFYHPRNGFYWAKPTSIFAPTSVDVEPLPLYTTPPAAQRPWQGLTDEDWEKVANRKNTVLDTFEQGATWAAYKLERRNT